MENKKSFSDKYSVEISEFLIMLILGVLESLGSKGEKPSKLCRRRLMPIRYVVVLVVLIFCITELLIRFV